MKPINLATLVVLVCFCISSCKKDKLPEAGGTTLDKVVIKGSNQTEISHVYSYDQQNRLISTANTALLTTPVIDNLFTYDAQGRLASHTVPGLLTYNFVFDANGRIVKKIGLPIMPNLQLDDFAYGYDAQNRVIADTHYVDHSNTIQAYNSYTYDASGNITEVNNFSRTGTGPLTHTGNVKFLYDNKINPYYNLRTALYFSTDNISALCRNNVSNINFGSSANSYNYSYYSNGLPQHQNMSHSSGQTVTTTFSFKQP